jgi:hypothetical protein
MRLFVVAISSVILFFPTFWLFNAVVGPNWGAGIAAVAMYIAFPVLALRIWAKRDPPAAQSMELALRDGKLAEAEYEITDAVAYAEEEDEGLLYLLSIGETRTLCLSGQYLYEPVERGEFPSSRVRVFWHKTDGFTYGIQCLGSPLAASKTVQRAEGGEQAMLEDRQVIEQALSSLVPGAA